MRGARQAAFGPERPLARVAAALLLAGTLAAGVVGCGGSAGPSAAGSSVTARDGAGVLVDVATFAGRVEMPGTVVLDVRTPAEFAGGHVPGAINLDVQDPGFADALTGLDPEARYAVYCRSGNRSAVAVALMVEAGITDVVHLDGGIGAWRAANLPVTTG